MPRDERVARVEVAPEPFGIEVLEKATDKAIDEAAAQISGKMSEISEHIEQQKIELVALQQRKDEELLRSVLELVALTGGRVIDLPQKGHGGTVAIPERNSHASVNCANMATSSAR